MNEYARIFALLATSLIVLVAQVSFSFALDTSTVTVATSGKISPSSGFDLKILSVAYSSSWVNDVNFARDNVDVLQIQWYSYQVPQLQNILAQLKAANPDLIVVTYIDGTLWGPFVDWYGDAATINSHEEWFIHDSNGNRLVVNWANPSNLMDISNTEWRKYLADWVVNTLTANPFLDGVFMDNVWVDFYPGLFNSTPYPNINDQVWHQNMLDFLTYLKGRMGNKLLIPNVAYANNDFSAAADGSFREGWIHPMWYNATNFGQGEYINFGRLYVPYNYLDMMQDTKTLVNMGKYFFALDGVETNSGSVPLADVKRVFYYSFCSFLLIANDKSCYCFEAGGSFDYSWNNPVDQTYNLLPLIKDAEQLGKPLGDYNSSANCLVRDFENGKVAVNYNSIDMSLNLGGQYKTLEGTPVTTVLMRAYTGAIFLKVP